MKLTRLSACMGVASQAHCVILQSTHNSGFFLRIPCICAVLAALIGEHGPARKLLPTMTDSAFHALANVVVSQQLSIHAAANISDRLATAAGVRACA